MSFNETIERIRTYREEIRDMYNDIDAMRLCAGCVRGPCIGEARGGPWYIFPQTFYMVGDKAYLRRCDIAKQTPSKRVCVTVHNIDGCIIVSLPKDYVIATLESPRDNDLSVFKVIEE